VPISVRLNLTECSLSPTTEVKHPEACGSIERAIDRSGMTLTARYDGYPPCRKVNDGRPTSRSLLIHSRDTAMARTIALLVLSVATCIWPLDSTGVALGTMQADRPGAYEAATSLNAQSLGDSGVRRNPCAKRETLRAHVDRDSRRDLVYHDWIRGRAVLGVCTGDGRTDRKAGLGMTELLQIIDVQRDGRDEIFYGGTTAVAHYFDVAVFRRGNLRRVLRPKGKQLTLVEGIEFATRGGTERRIGKAFGCQNTANGRTKEIVQSAAWRTKKGSHRFRWRRMSFRVRAASARRVLVEWGGMRARVGALAVARRLIEECRVKAGASR
jgi:hypothetical protein